MNRDRHLFEECLKLPRSQREEHLRQVCSADDEEVRRVLLLLKARDEASKAGLASQLFGSWLNRPEEKESDDIRPVGGLGDSEEDMKAYCNKCNGNRQEADERCTECGSARPKSGWPVDRRLGETVAGGQYRIVRRLGSGGFGVVYEVETVVGNLRRALKVLKEHWVENETVRSRFVNEALLLEEINHSNVARCFSAGTLDEGELYLLFELIDGISLSEILEQGTGEPAPLEPLRAIKIAKQIASGLVAAHSKQVLHRDLKPANILILNPGSEDEKAKLLDFGVAKLVQVDKTATGELVGTPAYMAPEQIRPDLPVGVGVDLWQLGAVLFTMLTGQPPYAGDADSLEDIVARFKRCGEPGPSPGEINSQLMSHPAVDGLVSQLLATDPSDRPDSAVQVCEELARIEQILSPALKSARPALLDALCAQPSQNSWAALCRYLGSQDAEVRLEADEKLSGWPTELRRATIAWWESTRRGETHPLWSLARSLDLSGRGLLDEDLIRLAENPALSSFRWLNLAGNGIGSEGIIALARSPFLSALEYLNVAENKIDADGIEVLSKSSHLKRLRSLSLAGNRIGVKGLEAIARSELPLRNLDLSDNDLRTEGAEVLARSTFKNLESLILRGNLFGPDGVAVLALSALLGGLLELDLARNAVGPGGAAALAVSKNLGRLRRMGLAQNNLGREGLILLLSSSGLDTLESLDVSSNALGPNGAMSLASSTLARRLRSLECADNQIEDAGLASFLGSPQFTGLIRLGVAQNSLTPSGIGLFEGAALQVESLDLSDNPLGQKGAGQLSRAIGHIRVKRLELRRTSLSGTEISEIVRGGLRSITFLDASHNELGASGAEELATTVELISLEGLALSGVDVGPGGFGHLVSSPHLVNLSRLVLDSNGIGDSGIVRMAASTGLMNLQELSLQDNRIGVEGALALATSPFATRLRKLDLSYNSLGDAGAEALAHGSGWQQLQELVLTDNEIGFGGAAALTACSSMEMLQKLELTGNPLRGELDIHSLARDKVLLMETSFAKISGDGKRFAERFYEELFSRFPGVKPLFANTTMSRQQQHLLSALVLVIENLRKPDAVEQSLADLGRRHVSYGVNPSNYYSVSSTLLDVLAETMGSEWDEEVQEAWSDGLEAVCRVMMNAHRQT